MQNEHLKIEAELPSTLSQDRRHQIESDVRNTLGRADARNVHFGWGEQGQDQSQGQGSRDIDEGRSRR